MELGLVALAAEDFVPVILSAVGFSVLARLSAASDDVAGRLVWAGTWLVVLGGVTKPVYKTMLALSGATIDVAVLDDVLFWLLAPGFLLAAAGLRRARRVDAGRSPVIVGWVVVVAVATVAAAAVLATIAEGRAWFLLLLAVSTVANLWVIAVLVGWSRARGDRTAAVMFLANITIVLGLAWAAASLPQTIPVQWGEQLASTAAQGAFLYGAVRLAGATATEVAPV